LWAWYASAWAHWTGSTSRRNRSFWAPVIGLAVVATAGAYLVQTWAQARLPAAVAALALTMEPVFASAFGVLVDHDELTIRIVLGGVLVVGAMILTALRTSAPETISRRQGAARSAASHADRDRPTPSG
jgi:drug/metabolite transporter (DMT)-like permease